MPLNPDYKSAFARDAATHEQGLSSGEARQALQQAAKDDTDAWLERQRKESAESAKSSGISHVTINRPHKALVQNGELVLEIKIPNATGGQDDQIILYNDLSLYDAGGGFLGIDNGTFTDSAIGGQVWLPTGMTVGAIRGSLTAFKIAVSVSGYAWAVVSIDDDGSGTTTGNITAVSIDVGATVPDSTTGTAYAPLGQYDVTAGVLSINNPQGIRSQTFVFCGTSYIFAPI